MKKLFIAAILIFVFTISHGQNYLCLARKAGDQYWGYINEKGELTVPTKYRKCLEFSSDGLAVVLSEGSKQYTFINSKGETLPTEVSTFKLMEIFGFGVKGFNDGMVAIRVGDKWGFLNTQGKLAVAIRYDDVSEFYDGFASARIGKKFFVLAADGKEKSIESVSDIKHFSEGLAPYYAMDKVAGFIDTNGDIVIRAAFKSVGYFSNGLAWAKLPDGKVGYINKKGEWAIRPTFDAAKDFDATSGMALVKVGEQWGYINDLGEKLNISLERYGDFQEGLCYGRLNDKVGFFNKSGDWVIKPQFEAVRDFKNGYAAAKVVELWGIIDKTGQWVVKPAFEGIRDMELIK